MFVGREKECALLRSALEADGSAVMVYGKRKIGKTTLINKVVSEREERYVYFECCEDTMQVNISSFTDELVRCGILPVKMTFASFYDVFIYLNSLPYMLTVIIDEYPYLKEMTAGKAVDSEFQNIADNRLSNIHLILSGSHVGMMRDLLEEDNALYGRFSQIIKLGELSYRECEDFYPQLSYYDRLAFYGVFGGSPYVNGFIDPMLPLSENIKRTVLNEDSMLYIYASSMLISGFSKSINAGRILSALGNGKKRYSEIENKLGLEKNGNLSKQLKQLEDMELITHVYPVNKEEDGKKSTYVINDNLLRFYYCFIYGKRSALQMLGPDGFYSANIEKGMDDFLSRRFEETGREYFSFLAKTGKLPGIKNIGTYYYDDPANRKNGEFDIALEYEDSVTIIEAKFLKKPVTLTMLHHEAGQIREIPGIRLREIGFLSASGFEEKENGYIYYSAEDMYKKMEANIKHNRRPL